MELSSLTDVITADDEPLEITILDRNRKPIPGLDGTPMVVGVLGSESKTYKRKRNASLKKLVQNGATDEEINVASAAAAIVYWRGPADGGKPAELTPENLKAFLSVEFILGQVQAGQLRKASFFGDDS